MSELQINVTSDSIAINGHTWDSAPSIEEVCRAIGSENLVDGEFINVQGKPAWRFRYFEDLGISILELFPERKVRSIAVHMQTPARKRRKPDSPYRNTTGFRRPTREAFSGRLHLNGKQLASPLPFSRFPLKGELHFIHRIAIGNRVSAGVSVELRFVGTVSFDFKIV